MELFFLDYCKDSEMNSSKPNVKPIPDGYHSITPHLIMRNANKAIEFYIKALGAKEIMRFAQPDGKIAHAEIEIGDSKIMLADEHLECGAQSPEHYGGTPVSLHLYVKDVDQVVQQAVTAGAKLERKPENMFYGDRIASILDPFGHRWSISTHIKDVTIEEMQQHMKSSVQKGECPVNSKTKIEVS